MFIVWPTQLTVDLVVTSSVTVTRHDGIVALLESRVCGDCRDVNGFQLVPRGASNLRCRAGRIAGDRDTSRYKIICVKGSARASILESGACNICSIDLSRSAIAVLVSSCISRLQRNAGGRQNQRSPPQQSLPGLHRA